MKRKMIHSAFIILLLSLPMNIGAQVSTVGTPPKAAEPVLLTSCGQSPGPARVKVFMDRLKMDYVYNTLATAADLVDAQKAGKPFRTLVIVTGASLKGMGAAGVSVEDELARTTALIAEAKKQGIMLVAAHVEGMERRAQGAAPGDNSDEQSIDAVCPVSKVMLVRQDGDEDHRFSILSQNGTVPLILFVKNLEMQDALKLLFGK
jgi:hypothetical protein